MTDDELMFWDRWPRLIPLYGALRDVVLDAFPDVSVHVSKTQISFYGRHMFAMASPPFRRKRDWPREFMMVSFGLPYRLDAPQIAAVAQPTPNRWTHHVLVERPEDLTPQLLTWIAEAYEFSQSKR